MRGSRGRRASRIGALVSVALTLLLAFPTVASAQVDIDDVVSGPGDKVDEAVDETTDTVDEVYGSTEEEVDDAAGSEGGIVDDTTDTLGRGTEATGQAVDDTVDDTTDAVEDASQGRIGPLDRPVEDTAGRVGGVVDSILGGDRDRSERRTGGTRSGSTNEFDPSRIPSGGIDGFVPSAGSATVSSGVALDRSQQAAQSATTTASSPLERLIQNIGEVLPKVAFPIALLALVAAFLVIQGRVDRSDPKLALAPIDVDQEYLSFR